MTTDSGKMTIEAGKKLTRIYSWGDRTKKVNLSARRERWYGGLGAYSPGGGRDVHANVEEGQQHFCSEQEAIEWLPWGFFRVPFAYTTDGLAVGWKTQKDPNSPLVALSVAVWQIYINGKKPQNLAGANNSAVKVYFKDNRKVPLPPVGDFIPSTPRVINGRLYSGKAIDYMNDPALQKTPADVERAISKGKVEKEGEYSIYYLFEAAVTIVKVDKTGRVIRVGGSSR